MPDEDDEDDGQTTYLRDRRLDDALSHLRYAEFELRTLAKELGRSPTALACNSMATDAYNLACRVYALQSDMVPTRIE